MSTRANIIIKDDYSKLFFYRHSDGYPEGALPTLEQFLEFVKAGHIRDNTGQAAGWLIVLGQKEYNVDSLPNARDGGYGWKVGSIEPSDGIHGDIEFLYVIDLKAKTIECVTSNFEQYK